MFYRRPNDRWRELVGPLEGVGPYELSLRDPVADIQIDKRRIALVPKEARIEGRMTAALCGELRLNGFEGWTVAAPQLTPTGDPELSRIDLAGRPNYQLQVTLLPPGGLPFDVVVSIAGRDAVVALRDGAILTAGSTADMSALRGALIVAPSRTVVELAPKSARAGGVSAIVDGEMPLGVLRSAIQESLASLADQDRLLELAFLGDNRPPIRICRFREQLLPFQDEASTGRRHRPHPPLYLSSEWFLIHGTSMPSNRRDPDFGQFPTAVTVLAWPNCGMAWMSSHGHSWFPKQHRPHCRCTRYRLPS